MAMSTATPVRAALAIALALAGCHRNDADDTTAAAAATAPPPAAAEPPAMETTTAMPPASTMPAPGATAAMPAGSGTAAMPPAAGAAMLNDGDKAFLTKVGKSNEEEIATTELAMQNGGEKAKALSQMLNTDHVALRGTVSALAPNMPAPTPGKAPASLSGMKSAAFDSRLYATYVDQHQGAIKVFTDASKDMTLSEPVRAFATQTLPTLHKHLQAVKDAQRAK